MQEEAFKDSFDSGATSTEDYVAPTSHNAIDHCIARNCLPRGNVPVKLCCNNFIVCLKHFFPYYFSL
jgi:hypothetical protein